MRLWTFQFPYVVRTLRRDGVYRPRWPLVSTAGPIWLSMYDWMVDELVARRLLRHRVAPIWAFHCSPQRQPPSGDDALSLFGNVGCDVFRLEIEVPENIVVLTDYGAWIDVFQVACKCLENQVPLIVPNKLRTRMFSINGKLSNPTGESMHLQACLPALRWRHVCDIRRFTLPDIARMEL